jgi:hypothetical protein
MPARNADRFSGGTPNADAIRRLMSGRCRKGDAVATQPYTGPSQPAGSRPIFTHR